MLAPRCVASLPPVQGPWRRGCWRQPCAETMARPTVCRSSTAGWLTLMPSLRLRSSRGWAGFNCDSLRRLTFHVGDTQITHGTWCVGLGLGLGTCRWRFVVGILRKPMLTRVPSQPGAGETEDRQRELFYSPGGSEIKLWRTRAPPSPSHKTADPELSTSRSAARQGSRPRRPINPL